MILRGYYSSEILHTATNIQFIIPDNAEGPYKVVYLLHGMHGNQGTWIDNTMLPYYSKDYNAIFVMPEAARSFYCDLKYGRKFFSFASEELPKITRRIFNISAQREDTAVIGCSMGGHGALKIALSKPEQFGFCGAISSACIYLKQILEGLRVNSDAFRKTGAEEEEIMIDLYSMFGDNLEYNPKDDIDVLAKNFPAGKPKPVIFSTCGTDDDLLKENLRFSDDMKKTGFNFTYEEWKGGHDWNFFNEALKKSIEFWYKPQRQP